jgi:hypothetical protein
MLPYAEARLAEEKQDILLAGDMCFDVDVGENRGCGCKLPRYFTDVEEAAKL